MITHNIYHTEYNLIQYDDFNYSIQKVKYCRQSGWELIRKKVAENDKIVTDEKEIERISLSRTKRRLKEICLCNHFTHFVTFTVSSQNADRFSLDEVQDLLKKNNKFLKRKYGNYKYVFVTEKHENGAFHFHGLISGLSVGEGFEYNENGYLTIPVVSSRIGFDCIKEITTGLYDYQKLCSYIQKYITKDMCKKYNGQLYFCSKGLKRADRYIIKDVPNDIYWDFENDFTAIKDFNYKNKAEHDDLKYTIVCEKKLLDFFKN